MTSKRSARGVRRPSPALVVSIIALVVACTGTAVAAGVLIKRSSQLGKGVVVSKAIKDGTITGKDVKSGAIGNVQLHNGSVDASKLSKAVKFAANTDKPVSYEAFNPDGPTVPKTATMKIATLAGLPPGPYLIIAKTVVGRLAPPGAFEKINSSVGCTLDAAGDTDRASGPTSSTGSNNQTTLEMQITRNFASTADVTLMCSSDADWHAGSTSIIAVALANASRRKVGG